MTDIQIPHNGWLPRWHQMRLWDYLRDGGKRAMAVWHRRAGKDEVCLHHVAVSRVTRPGNYFYCLPEFEQGRRVVWAAVNPHSGIRRIDEAFPQSMRANTNDHSMFLRFHNGSTFNVVGSDNYDTSLVGSSMAGIVFSRIRAGQSERLGLRAGRRSKKTMAGRCSFRRRAAEITLMKCTSTRSTRPAGSVSCSRPRTPDAHARATR